MLVYFLFVVGFVLLIKGADWLIDGASGLAHRFRIPEIVIGLTVVAFGTSAPELAVNVVASIKGTDGITIGNIIGSNIANILLILGVSAMIMDLKVSNNTVWRQIPFSLFAALILGYMANDRISGGASTDIISRADGLVLIGLFVLFLFYTFRLSKKQIEESAPETDLGRSIGMNALLLLVGLAGLVIGGRWIVQGAEAMALVMHFSPSFIGFTIVALGTSLPELATSVMAVRKGNTDLAIGNVIGSIIFNTFWVLGLSAIIRPIAFSQADDYSVAVNILCSLVLFLLLFVGKRHVLQRWQGMLLLIGYIAYIIYLTVAGRS